MLLFRTNCCRIPDDAEIVIKEERMTTQQEFNEYGELLEKTLRMHKSPLAVKMLVNEADIPQGAYRPKRDDGIHYSQ